MAPVVMTSVLVKALYVTVPRTPTTGIRTATAGQTVTVPDDVAKRWVRLGAAELVDASPAAEDAPDPVLIEVDGQQVDLNTIDDAARLREIATAAGLEIAGNVKKVDTIRAKLIEHLNASPAAEDGDGTGEAGGGDE